MGFKDSSDVLSTFSLGAKELQKEKTRGIGAVLLGSGQAGAVDRDVIRFKMCFGERSLGLGEDGK